MTLPRVLLALGSFILVFSLYKILEQTTRGPRGEGHFAPSDWHMDMDTAAANGRVDWITLPARWNP